MASCNKCEKEYGITCEDRNFLFWFDKCWVFIHGEAALTMPEPVAECPILTGEVSQEKVAKKILKNAELLMINDALFNHKPGNYM